MSKYGVYSGPYFPALGLNTKIYSVHFRIHSEYRKIRTRKNLVFGHFSRSVMVTDFHFPNITNQFVSLFLLLGLLMKNLWRSCFAFTSSSLVGTSNSLLLCILGLTIILYPSDTWSWSWSGPSSKRGQFFLIITMVTINF